MQNLLDLLAQTRGQIEDNARHIVRLQQEILRLQQEGKDPSEVRGKLSQVHALHLQVLGVREQLNRMLKEVSNSGQP